MSFNEIAQSYSGAVDAYEAGRPGYPAVLVSALPLGSARVVVELGAGTGKLTRLLLPHVSDMATIVAVEPVSHMATKLPKDPKVFALNCPASETGLDSGAADLVVCGQAFHWFDDEASVAEIARLLRPGGTLALIWNIRDERVAWAAEISRLVDGYAGSTPRFQSKRWQWILSDPRFSFDRKLIEPHPHAMPREGVYARVLSTSFIARLPDAEKLDVRSRIDAILDAHGLRDASEVTMPYVSRLYLLTRR